MEKDFDGWNEIKKLTNNERPRLYNVREIWWYQPGLNVGSELNGKGELFLRPGVIIRGFGKDTCLIVPLTTSTRDHWFRIPVGKIQHREARANISQMRVVDTRRLAEKIGFLDKEVFERIKESARTIF